jgi:hypothetical protein
MSSSTTRARYPTDTTSQRSTGVVPRRGSLIVDGAPLAVVAGGDVALGYRHAVFVDFYAGIPSPITRPRACGTSDCSVARPRSSRRRPKRYRELAAHRSVYIVERPEHAGHAMHTIFVDDPDALVAEIAARASRPRPARPTTSMSAR